IDSMSTAGDRNQTTPLHLLSPYSSTQPAKSLWTDELEARLLSGELDLLVHSLKDVPTVLKEGCEIACILEREDPRDALVMRMGRTEKGLGELEKGSVVGTGSVRRVAQLKRAFPHLEFKDMRGNLNTRFRKLDDPSSPYSALILALSGLTRLGLSSRTTSHLSSPELYHAVGQGALAVEVRVGDTRIREALKSVGHWETEWRCGAERGLLRVLEGGCSVPVGVETVLEEIKMPDAPSGSQQQQEQQNGSEKRVNGKDKTEQLETSSPTLHFSGLLPPSSSYPLPGENVEIRPRFAMLKLTACVTSLDGDRQVVKSIERKVGSYRQAERLGEELAREMRTHGAGEILDEINQQRREREQRDLEEALARSK
ncbi:hypothetical protein TREMEDRAFT_15236, partial [Tremella mesenterica DSM 1558]|uniref:uncharacterized protein n=1 Tax=Tremella mesenterica (strain ATCC 24925 / CBS 8224 / DSM 1558 / NBRC 9311 / NRRL Y-6157 / RJB 2259-6 / UBC 559-6) TaxID=578456 RepID=UPI0003F48ECA